MIQSRPLQPLPEPARKLTEQHLKLVSDVAQRIGAKLPRHVSSDDLVQAGTFGLMRAARNFDPALGVKFTTYASRTIQGSIIDWLRGNDWVPQLERQRQKIDGRSTVGVESLHRIAWETDSGRTVATGNLLPAARGPVVHTESVEALSVGMTRQERMIFRSYWFDGLTMRQIGIAVGISESGVSQVMTKLIARLRERFTESQFRDLFDLGRSRTSTAVAKSSRTYNGRRAA